MLVDLLLEQETVDGADAEDLIRLGRIRTEAEREADDPKPETPSAGETVAPNGDGVPTAEPTPCLGGDGTLAPNTPEEPPAVVGDDPSA
jgi:hypothetical protein